MNQRIAHPILVAFLTITVAESLSVAAAFKELASRLPADANALVTVDVEKLLSSPVGQKEHWREQHDAAMRNKPMIVPPGAVRVVTGSVLSTQTLQSAWEVSVIELSQAPSIKAIAAIEGGFVDTVGGKSAARSPENAWFIQLDSKLLGVVCPAQRQFAARWAKQDATQGGKLSPYLQAAAAVADTGGVVTMAIDMTDAASAPAVDRWLAEEPFAGLDGKEIDMKALAGLLGGIKGLLLTVDVRDDISGRCAVEFSSDASILGSVGKPMMLEMLSRSGMTIADVQAWESSVSGSKLVMQGKLSTDGLSRLLSVLQPPSPTRMQEASPDPKPAGDAKAGASQEYYRTVSGILEKIGTPSAPTNQSGWLVRDARRIERLPALNVDSDLLAWGARISTALDEAAHVLDTGSLNAKAKVASIQGPGGGYSGDSASEQQARADYHNVQRQRQQAAAEERAKAAEAAGKILLDAKATRAKIRADMVARYNAEF